MCVCVVEAGWGRGNSVLVHISEVSAEAGFHLVGVTASCDLRGVGVGVGMLVLLIEQ